MGLFKGNRGIAMLEGAGQPCAIETVACGGCVDDCFGLWNSGAGLVRVNWHRSAVSPLQGAFSQTISAQTGQDCLFVEISKQCYFVVERRQGDVAHAPSHFGHAARCDLVFPEPRTVVGVKCDLSGVVSQVLKKRDTSLSRKDSECYSAQVDKVKTSELIETVLEQAARGGLIPPVGKASFSILIDCDRVDTRQAGGMLTYARGSDTLAADKTLHLGRECVLTKYRNKFDIACMPQSARQIDRGIEDIACETNLLPPVRNVQLDHCLANAGYGERFVLI